MIDIRKTSADVGIQCDLEPSSKDFSCQTASASKSKPEELPCNVNRSQAASIIVEDILKCLPATSSGNANCIMGLLMALRMLYDKDVLPMEKIDSLQSMCLRTLSNASDCSSSSSEED